MSPAPDALRPSPPPEPERKRLQFDFAPEAANRLDDLVRLLGASSRAEVVRRALLLLDHASTQQARGGTLQIAWPDGHSERLILF